LNEIQLKWIFRLAVLLLGSLTIYLLMKLTPLWLPVLTILMTFLIPFFISIFITYLLHPLIEKIHYHGLPRPVAILLIYILFFGGIGFGIYRGIPTVIGQLRDLAESSPELLDSYRLWLAEIQKSTSNLPNGLHERIEEAFTSAEESLDFFVVKVISILKLFLNSIILLAVIPFIVFYMLKDYDQMKKALWYITPRKWRQATHLFFRDVDESLGNYIRGQLLVCLIIGIIATISLWLSGMEYPLLLGIIIGTTNIIPYFGPLIGAIPAAIIAATISVRMMVVVLIIIFTLQFIEGNLLSPIIVGKSLHMHPLMIMAALLLGGEIGGVIGLIIAVPVLAIIKVFIVHAKLHFTSKETIGKD
jgi:predicted PurR-regulated permease PerM